MNRKLNVFLIVVKARALSAKSRPGPKARANWRESQIFKFLKIFSRFFKFLEFFPEKVKFSTMIQN